MIRLKHNKYPVWLTWEGDVDTFKKVKQFVEEDIKLSGFAHYEAWEDVAEDPSDVEPVGNEWIDTAKTTKPKKTNTKASTQLGGTVKTADGTNLSFGVAEEDPEDSVEDTIVDGNIPNTEGSIEGGLKKFQDNKKK